MNGMIRTGRFEEFVVEVINMHNEENKDKTLWDVWLHRVFDKSFADFTESLDQSHKEAPTEEEVANIVNETRNILNAFSPTKPKE